MKHHATIQSANGEEMDIVLEREGGREVGTLFIDGVQYHVERIKATTLERQYHVDGDKDYKPQCDSQGRCVIVAPFSKR